LPKSCFLFEGA
jgi:hypothetical protein